MDITAIFITQLVLSIVVYALIAKWYVVPWLAQKPLEQALIALIFPHAMRHLGLTFLAPSVIAGPLPGHFASAAAYGDFASGLLAILCLIALRNSWKLALPLVWIFNVVGSVDLLNALRQAEAIPYLGGTWYIPTFVVPVLLVTHVLIFARLMAAMRRPVAATAN